MLSTKETTQDTDSLLNTLICGHDLPQNDIIRSGICIEFYYDGDLKTTVYIVYSTDDDDYYCINNLVELSDDMRNSTPSVGEKLKVTYESEDDKSVSLVDTVEVTKVSSDKTFFAQVINSTLPTIHIPGEIRIYTDWSKLR